MDAKWASVNEVSQGCQAPIQLVQTSGWHVFTFTFNISNFVVNAENRIGYPFLSLKWIFNPEQLPDIHNGARSFKEWFWESFESMQGGKVHQVQPVWLFIVWYRQHEEAHEITQWRKAQQMQPMWIFVFFHGQFEKACKSTQRRKAKQVQRMWLRIFLCKQFE